MSFASELKDELALSATESEKDELSALFRTSGNITLSNRKWKLNFKSENSKVAQSVYRKVVTLYNVKPITSIYKSMKLNKNNVYCITIEENVVDIINDLGLTDESHIKEVAKKDKRIKSYLAGCFMGTGSVNNPTSTNYHLEMSFIDESFAKEIIRIMSKINIEAKMIKRRNVYVVYVKRAQLVGDFIAAIGGNNSYLKFEDVRINRDFFNNDNRLDNCDIANSVRTNVAALSQLEDIKLIDKQIGIKMLDQELQVLARLRLENQEDSLRQLADKYNELMKTNYTKSGINHLFIKIKNIASSYKRGESDGKK